jgi:hypothetical protein
LIAVRRDAPELGWRLSSKAWLSPIKSWVSIKVSFGGLKTTSPPS